MPTSKSETTSDRAVFFVEAAFLHGDKRFIETDAARSSRLEVIADIFTGEIARPVRILECDLVAGTCRDVTTAIARDLYAHIQDGGEPCPTRLRDFLDLCLGASTADQLDISTGNFNVERTASRLRLIAAE